ncbi:MAG: cyclic nucleotide-binding domain-containing protein [Pseudobdellovibrio sp.]
MKIEASPVQFHPACQFEKLKLSPLQVQYLIFLRMNKSIYELVQHNLKNGMLVSFSELYLLIELLANHHWIINPEIKDYFDNQKIDDTKKSFHFSSTTDTEPSSKKTKSDYQQFMELPFFRSLDPKLSEFLFQSARKYQLISNTFICNAKTNSRNLFVLLNGQAGIYKTNGNVKQMIALLNRSAVFGEAGFLLDQPRTADVLTTKDSEILMVPYNAHVLDPYLNKEKATQLQYRFWVQHALLHSEMFKNIPPDCLDALTFSGKIVEIKQDKILFKQGDQSETAYIVIQGALAVEKNNKLLTSLTQGAFVGEISLMASKGIRTATVTSQKDTLLLEIHRDEFYKLLSQNLFLAKELEKLVKQRLNADIQRLK